MENKHGNRFIGLWVIWMVGSLFMALLRSGEVNWVYFGPLSMLVSVVMWYPDWTARTLYRIPLLRRIKGIGLRGR
jgi:hypothetical protein